MKVVLVSFASSKYYDIQNRLSQSSIGNGVDYCINYTESSIDSDFIHNNLDIWNNPRGFGYWIWKPYIILDAMQKVDYGDLIIYVDAGNIISHTLYPIIEEFNSRDIILFDNRDCNPYGQCWRNSEWTKGDCFGFMNCNTEEYWSGKQINASYQAYKKTDTALKFLSEYMESCSDYRIITDRNNETYSNQPSFIEHRHDQSIASLLAIKYNIELFPDPSQWGNGCVDRKYPQLFWHCRDQI